jgi:hypothetical protein
MGGKPRQRLVVGWREWVELPGLAANRIKAKVDTGARTSALHAEDVRIVRKGSRRFARFVIPEDADELVEVIAPLVTHREIRSSNGTAEQRPIISAQLLMGGRLRRVEIGLTFRDTMGFRLLLGRQAIRRFRATVDPRRSFLTTQTVVADSA